jgi:hypothetical protein
MQANMQTDVDISFLSSRDRESYLRYTLLPTLLQTLRSGCPIVRNCPQEVSALRTRMGTRWSPAGHASLRVAEVGVFPGPTNQANEQDPYISAHTGCQNALPEITKWPAWRANVPLPVLKGLYGAPGALKSGTDSCDERPASCQILIPNPWKSKATRNGFAQLLHKRWITL